MRKPVIRPCHPAVDFSGEGQRIDVPVLFGFFVSLHYCLTEALMYP